MVGRRVLLLGMALVLVLVAVQNVKTWLAPARPRPVGSVEEAMERVRELQGSAFLYEQGWIGGKVCRTHGDVAAEWKFGGYLVPVMERGPEGRLYPHRFVLVDARTGGIDRFPGGYEQRPPEGCDPME